MSCNMDSPVQTQMAVAVPNHIITSECHGKSNSEGKPVGRRRVFVQTETGCVLGLELDRRDNAHTVKRKLQVALNFPTEESSLTFGDLVLENDLSAIRADSPLLLTRNTMHRSSSTPCLSPSIKDLQQHKDSSGVIEILGRPNHCVRMKQLVKDVMKAIRCGVDPIPVSSGLGGVYYFRNSRGDKVAIVKPTDEEPFAPNNPKGYVGKALGQPGLKRSVRVGETGFREVAAYILDYDNFANVPPTALVKISHSVFHINDGVNNMNPKICDVKPEVINKIASIQQFIQHDFDASDYGTSSFPVTAVHRIGILDIRIFNTDRHAGNLLVRKVDDGVGRFGGKMELIPIDHGLCLPENLEDPYFEWIHWPQASVPFSEEELEYIANLDPVKDCDMLRMELPMIREACLRILVLCTIFLKEAASFGLCLAEIGEMMSREFRGMEEEPSGLEVICMEARKLVSERESFSPKSEKEDEDDFQFHIDCEEDNHKVHKSIKPFSFGFRGINFRNQLAKLDETLEDEEEDEHEENNDRKTTDFPCAHDLLPNVSNLSASLKGAGLSEKISRYQIGAPKRVSKISKSQNRSDRDFQGGNSRSADEQLFRSISFVKLADMGEEEWGAFLGIFQELLPDAFVGRKAMSSRQKLRLGTSCQF